jgi:predicted RNA binding protein YcfA (HicA-like mRNA interferase family)
VYRVYTKRVIMNSKELIKILEKDGWYKCHQKGRVTVPHPKKDLPIKTLNSILKQANLGKLKR